MVSVMVEADQPASDSTDPRGVVTPNHGLAVHQHHEEDGYDGVWRDVTDTRGILSWRFDDYICGTPLCRKGGFFTMDECASILQQNDALHVPVYHS